MLPVVMLAAAAVGAGMQMSQNKKGKDAAFDQAKLKERETMERARRMTRQHSRVLGQANAAAHAGGLQMTGSNASYIDDMQQEQARELSWMIEAGRREASAIRKGAAIQTTSANINAVSGVVGAGAGAAGKWWGGK